MILQDHLYISLLFYFPLSFLLPFMVLHLPVKHPFSPHVFPFIMCLLFLLSFSFFLGFACAVSVGTASISSTPHSHRPPQPFVSLAEVPQFVSLWIPSARCVVVAPRSVCRLYTHFGSPLPGALWLTPPRVALTIPTRRSVKPEPWCSPIPTSSCVAFTYGSPGRTTDPSSFKERRSW